MISDFEYAAEVVDGRVPRGIVIRLNTPEFDQFAHEVCGLPPFESLEWVLFCALGSTGTKVRAQMRQLIFAMGQRELTAEENAIHDSLMAIRQTYFYSAPTYSEGVRVIVPPNAMLYEMSGPKVDKAVWLAEAVGSTLPWQAKITPAVLSRTDTVYATDMQMAWGSTPLLASGGIAGLADAMGRLGVAGIKMLVSVQFPGNVEGASYVIDFTQSSLRTFISSAPAATNGASNAAAETGENLLTIATLTAERDALASERDRAVAECRNNLLQKDQKIGERDKIISERDRLIATHASILRSNAVELDRLTLELNKAAHAATKQSHDTPELSAAADDLKAYAAKLRALGVSENTDMTQAMASLTELRRLLGVQSDDAPLWIKQAVTAVVSMIDSLTKQADTIREYNQKLEASNQSMAETGSAFTGKYQAGDDSIRGARQEMYDAIFGSGTAPFWATETETRTLSFIAAQQSAYSAVAVGMRAAYLGQLNPEAIADKDSKGQRFMLELWACAVTNATHAFNPVFLTLGSVHALLAILNMEDGPQSIFAHEILRATDTVGTVPTISWLKHFVGRQPALPRSTRVLNIDVAYIMHLLHWAIDDVNVRADDGFGIQFYMPKDRYGKPSGKTSGAGVLKMVAYLIDNVHPFEAEGCLLSYVNMSDIWKALATVHFTDNPTPTKEISVGLGYAAYVGRDHQRFYALRALAQSSKLIADQTQFNADAATQLAIDLFKQGAHTGTGESISVLGPNEVESLPVDNYSYVERKHLLFTPDDNDAVRDSKETSVKKYTKPTQTRRRYDAAKARRDALTIKTLADKRLAAEA